MRVRIIDLAEKDISWLEVARNLPFGSPSVLALEIDIGLGVVVACLPSFLP